MDVRRGLLLLAVIAFTGAIFASAAAAASAGHATDSTLSPPAIHEPFGSPPPCTGKPGHRTTVQLEACLEREILKTDATIEGFDRAIVSRLSSTSQQRGFIAGARAWLAYRKADCEAMADLYEGGSLGPVVYAECVVARNAQRLKDLRKFRSIASA